MRIVWDIAGQHSLNKIMCVRNCVKVIKFQDNISHELDKLGTAVVEARHMSLATLLGRHYT